jgi:hypothetical protein
MRSRNFLPICFLVLVVPLAMALEAAGQDPCDPLIGKPDLHSLCEHSALKQNAGFTALDRSRMDVVLRNTQNNPQLQAHLLSLLTDPVPSRTTVPSGDGNWAITVPFTIPCPPNVAGCVPQTSQETVITSGMSMKLAGIFRSVNFMRDNEDQLMLYTKAYNHLPRGFVLPGGVVPPTPSSLARAPLAVIQNALGLIGTAWQAIVPILPPPSIPPSTADCDTEMGTTPQHANYGDRTGNKSACTPSAIGLFASLSDASFPARKYLTCVKQQGARLTCHTFAATSAMEMVVSQNFGIKANLAEQDLMEHYRLLWSPGFMHETGDAFEELSGAISHNYFFAYEDQWDYNPSYGRSFDSTAGLYVNSCINFPSSEPGCSESAPQAPGFCFDFPILFFVLPVCFIHDAGVVESPYQPTSLTRFWNPSDTELSKEYMILNIAFNNAVVLGFNTTPKFDNANSSGGYVVFDAIDTSQNNGGHYVHVVGVATNSELPQGAPAAVGGGYFIVKNSWNNCFGDAGYLYLDWDYVKAVGWDGFSVN